MNQTIEFYVSIQDDRASNDELHAILSTLETEFKKYDATVLRIETVQSTPGDIVTKGDEQSGILDVQINLDAIKSIAKWIYERIVGTTTVVEFEYEGAKFKFNGRNDNDRVAAMKDFEAFCVAIEAQKHAKNG